jgi:hypothetical protein
MQPNNALSLVTKVHFLIVGGTQMWIMWELVGFVALCLLMSMISAPQPSRPKLIQRRM